MAVVGEVDANVLAGASGATSAEVSAIQVDVTDIKATLATVISKLDTIQADVTIIKTNTTPA